MGVFELCSPLLHRASFLGAPSKRKRKLCGSFSSKEHPGSCAVRPGSFTRRFLKNGRLEKLEFGKLDGSGLEIAHGFKQLEVLEVKKL